jgi:hypothetical protein
MLICTWCGEEGDACWCSSLSEDFKNGKTDNPFEIEPTED